MNLTLSNVKLPLSNDFIDIGNVVMRVKLVVLTAVDPPGLGTEMDCETFLHTCSDLNNFYVFYHEENYQLIL